MLYRRGVFKQTVDPKGARTDIGEALGYFRSVGDPERIMSSLGGLGLLELMDGDVTTGRAHLEEARAVARDWSSSRLLVATTNLGLAALMEGEVDSAISLLAESLVLIERFDDTREVPYNLLAVGLCLTAVGDLERAVKLHGAADAVIEAMEEAFEPLEAQLRRQDHSRLARDSGEAAFDFAYRVGRRLSSEQALELANEALKSSEARKPTRRTRRSRRARAGSIVTRSR